VPATMPPRSRLYSLEPIGIGTPETESLTSYISRLAAAHSVRVRDLVIGELLAHTRRPHLADNRHANLPGAFWRRETRTLNGTRSLARRMVHGLEEETGRRDLRFLTLLTWCEVLPAHQLQKTTRAWCPGCFQDWRDRGQAIYDPLLWTLAPVTVCARHRRPLRTICPFPECRRSSPWLGLGYRSRPGHCAHCGGWLGSPGAESGTPEEKLVIEDAVRSHAWIFDALGELIAAAPSMPRHPQREDELRGIEAAFRVAALRKITIDRRSSTRHLGLASGTVLMRWLGGMPPSLWSLLVVCSQIGISPLQLVRGEIDENDTDAAAPNAPADIRLERPPIQHTRIDPVVIRDALKAVLASDQPPPPSMRLVADRLGQTPANLHLYFPELCRAIASRHRSFLEAQGARFRTRLRERVRDAAIALTHRGLYPSASHIADLLGDRNVMRSHTALAAWREVLGELGWQHHRAAGAADDLLSLLATSRQGAAKFQTLTSSADP
jgi:TniQ